MKKYVKIKFLDYALERALKTAIQALFVGGFVGGGFFDLPWAEIASLSGGMAFASVLTSILFYKGDGSDRPDDISIGIPGKHSTLD